MAAASSQERLPSPAAQATKPFRFRLRPFVIFLSIMVAVIVFIALLMAYFLSLPFPTVLWWAFVGFGAAYIGSSLLAWTGFANMYRYSPMLLAGSRSYRASVLRGDMYWEGRDLRSLAVGCMFGGVLIALGLVVFAITTLFPSP